MRFNLKTQQKEARSKRMSYHFIPTGLVTIRKSGKLLVYSLNSRYKG